MRTLNIVILFLLLALGMTRVMAHDLGTFGQTFKIREVDIRTRIVHPTRARHMTIFYHYDRFNRLKKKAYSSHLQTQYTYDEYNALSTLVHEQLGKTTKLITKFAYTYNQDGNIQTRIRSNQQGEQAKETYTYDKDNNLTSYQCQGSLCPQDQRHNTINSQHYTFDAVNNIKSIQSSLTNAQGKVITNTTTYEYSRVLPTRLIGYQNSDPDYGSSPTLLYDKDGNMVQDDQHQLLTYDALDRTQAIHKAGENTPLVTYLYNGDNIQIGTQNPKQDPTYFIYGQGKLTNTQQGNNTTSYLYGGKQRLAKVENPNTTYYLTDQGQSVIHLVQTTKDNGPKVIASYDYSPYGIETTLSQSDKKQATKRFGFDGQLTDPTTGWQFLGKGYRAYNPLLHRFMSQDSMSPFDKGGINGYFFANNNPIMQFDPSGHFSVNTWLDASFGLLGVAGSVLGVFFGGPGAFSAIPVVSGMLAFVSGGLGTVSAINGNALLQNTSLYSAMASVAFDSIDFGVLTLEQVLKTQMQSKLKALHLISSEGSFGEFTQQAKDIALAANAKERVLSKIGSTGAVDRLLGKGFLSGKRDIINMARENLNNIFNSYSLYALPTLFSGRGKLLASLRMMRASSFSTTMDRLSELDDQIREVSLSYAKGEALAKQRRVLAYQRKKMIEKKAIEYLAGLKKPKQVDWRARVSRRFPY